MNRKINNKNNSSDILKEMAVFDYVAGNQSESARKRFEKLLASDETLRKAVDQERLLRKNLLKVAADKPVSMSNFDSLIAKIDKLEAEPSINEDTNVEHQISSTPEAGILANDFKQEAVKEASERRFWQSNSFATAASIACFMVVFAGVYQSAINPKFETLSDKNASQDIGFQQLMEQSRILKIDFTSSMNDEDIERFLIEHQLEKINAGGNNNRRFLTSKFSILDKELQILRKDSRIKSAELLTVKNGH